MRSLAGLLCGLGLTCVAGCLAFNPDCPADETAMVGRSEALLDLRRAFVRTSEAPIGNLITDAFYQHLANEFGNLPGLAVVNGGAIRDRTECEPREFIDRGPITLGQLIDMLPFDNRVALVEVSEGGLWRALEHSVARLGDPGEAGLAGQFLQVSHLRFTVDCSQPAAQPGVVVGQRITELHLLDRNGNSTELRRDAVSDTNRYRIATNSFLADGSDGYDGLFARQTLPGEQQDFVVVANYIANNTPVSPEVEGRITLQPSCVFDGW